MKLHFYEGPDEASELLKLEVSQLIEIAREWLVDLDALRDYSGAWMVLQALKDVEHPNGVVNGVDVNAERARAEAMMHSAGKHFPAAMSRDVLEAFAMGWMLSLDDFWRERDTAFRLRTVATINGQLVGMTLGTVSDGAGSLARRMLARNAALAMRHKNPRFAAIQTAKSEAEALWQERRAGKHPKLRTNEQFAIECQRRWPALTSVKVILGWCTDWNKQAKRSKTRPAS